MLECKALGMSFVRAKRESELPGAYVCQCVTEHECVSASQ